MKRKNREIVLTRIHASVVVVIWEIFRDTEAVFMKHNMQIAPSSYEQPNAASFSVMS